MTVLRSISSFPPPREGGKDGYEEEEMGSIKCLTKDHFGE